MTDFFSDKVFIITGASSGLGLKISKNLAQKGCQTVLFARKISSLEIAKKEISTTALHSPLLISGDVTQEKDVRLCIDKVIKKYGHIDGMILNAGMSMWKKFLNLSSPQEMREIMEVNYWGVLNFCYYGIPHIKNSSGKVVVISSLQSLIGVPYHTGYAASKHALNGFIESLHLEEKVSLLNVIVSWIRGTSLRKNSLGFQEEPKNQTTSKTNGTFSLSVEECAQKIIDAIPLNKKTIYLPKFVALFPLVKFVFPNWLSQKIKKAVNKEVDKKV